MHAALTNPLEGGLPIWRKRKGGLKTPLDQTKDSQDVVLTLGSTSANLAKMS